MLIMTLEILSLIIATFYYKCIQKNVTSTCRIGNLPHSLVKKTSLEESLAKSRAYNSIRDSGKTLGEREKSRQKSHPESQRESRLDSW